MASEYRIHRPYVLAVLPRPLDHTDGRIVAREVYGQREGQKKRKRTELVVGVDGETTSIYDIPASRLITSYPIPPQESFTCPPYSVRVRRRETGDVARYTFIATREAAVQKITLFKDTMHPDGKTTSTSSSQALRASPVLHLTCPSAQSPTSTVGDVVAVCKNGEVFSLSAETLAVHWSVSAKSAVQDVLAATISDFEIEYVTAGSVTDFSDGVFKKRPEIFSALPRALDSNPEILAMISKSSQQGQENRHLIMAAAMPGSSSAQSDMQRLILLETVPLPTTASGSQERPVFEIDLQLGLVLQLQHGALSVYDVTGAVPKLKSIVQMDNANSFTRLSRPFVLAASMDSLGLYNHQYRSIHAKTSLDLSELPAESQGPRACHLISHLRSQELIVALIDNVLVSIQVEPPKHHGKRRKEGLLIDSIGRGTAVEIPAKKLRCENSSPEFSHRVPGTMTESYLAKYHEEVAAADELLSSNDLAGWEQLFLKQFHMSLKTQTQTPNGNGVNGHTNGDTQELPEWDWGLEPSGYPAVDRRWVIYAISQVFSIEAGESDDSRPKLRLILPESNVTTYLAIAGHMTLSNIKSAFREDIEGEAVNNKHLAGDVIECLTEADGSMSLLLSYIEATKLGELELILAIRALMLSMDLISDSDEPKTMKLLSNAPYEANESQDMDLDDLERELAITEHYLGDDSSSRSRGLTLALAKLWRRPASSTVKALRTSLQTEDIASLICLLRVELVRGAWTSLYIDPTSFNADGQDPPPDGVIALIADLLGRCLDAIGAGGWLVNDAMSPDRSEAGDFLTALKLETTAALEGIEEAVYLNGVVGEAVRFGLAAQKGGASRQTWNTNKPISMHLEGRESRLLPLGLKAKQLPTKGKVVSGGEVVQRSAREMGHLISQKVEPYSLEKVAI